MVRRFVGIALLLLVAGGTRAASRYVADRAAGPVHWERWGSAAFARAQREKRPIFLSIGFASSYECYRMHREAFLNGENAETLNTNFVPVLLDRVESPEVAKAYEAAALSLGVARGWPVHLVLNARLEPFAAAGFMKPDELSRFLVINANRFKESAGASGFSAPAAEAGAAALDIDKMVEAIGKTYDTTTASFGEPRPRPMTVSFLLRYAARMKHEGIRGAALEHLRRMAIAPIRDQLGGGFHRQAREAAWRDPYFEKMLPDQALLSIAYLEAWQATNDPELAYLSRTTLDYVLRDLRGGGRGTFDASQDAYNYVPLSGPELVNGNFYQWQKDEIARLVGREPALKVFIIYGMKDAVPNLPALPAWPVLAETHTTLAAPLAKMLDLRQKRPEPSREFNVISGWNGLMISALARAGAAFGEPRYVDAAGSAAQVLLPLLPRGAKARTLAHGEGTEALAEDYAMLVQGLLDLYDAGHDIRRFEQAVALQKQQDQLFWNASAGAYTTGVAVPQPVRNFLRERDDETPAANSVAALNLLRLAALTGNETWAARPAILFQAFGARMRARGADFAQMASAYELSLIPPSIVVVTGDPRKKQTYDLLASYAQHPEPMRALVFLPHKGPERQRVVTALPFTGALQADPEKAVAYLCAEGECRTVGG
ncbi:MAG: DUF255 domain-containing protein [Acidobacteriota bacterium]